MRRCLLICALAVYGSCLFSQEKRNEVILTRDENKKCLSLNHDYYYYKQRYDGSENRLAAGILLTSIGIGIEFVWLTTCIIGDSSYYANFYSKDMSMIGMVYVSVGVPLLISGAIRAANNRKAMEEFDRPKSLSFGYSKYGIGLIYRF